MRNDNIPKTVQHWIDQHKDIIDDHWVEPDHFGGYRNPYSVWVYFKPGWICDGMHLIHECTVKDFMEHTKMVEPCDCERCEEAIREGRSL